MIALRRETDGCGAVTSSCSVQSHPESGQSYISAVYNDSVAARDGRLRRGDVILQVNDENVTSMKTPEVIDLLRILRGSICITVLRPPNAQ
ncbi:ligand of Numb protein X 2-like [Ostrinia furnacalis]|uniref:ligand of Numb protein X 2-like n=1 Tax=Ostrinia furnacalis TaxID=93504 RepID=UPI00104089E3|nr:ligand of Numb protein X 2-like [Ostrinia furnacalis]